MHEPFHQYLSQFSCNLATWRYMWRTMSDCKREDSHKQVAINLEQEGGGKVTGYGLNSRGWTPDKGFKRFLLRSRLITTL